MAEFSRRKRNCGGFVLFIATFLVLISQAPAAEKRPWQLAYYPSMGKIRLAFEDEDTRPETPVPVRVTDDSGNDILNSSVTLGSHGTALMNVGDVSDGKYTVHVTLPGTDETQTEYFERTHFEWENNRLGITDKVYPPFKPIGVEDDRVEVVMRRYRKSGLGLWTSVESRSNDGPFRELLADPIRLTVNDEETLAGEGRFTETDDHEVVYEGEARHDAVKVETRTTTEYDGAMKVELTLKPGPDPDDSDNPALRSLTLDIPVRDEMAPLWHALKCNIRSNPAGRTPAGSGKIWDSSMLKDGKWPGNFKHYIWLGGEERGIAWFADNEKGWVVDWDNQPPCQTLHRRDGVLTLRVHLVQKPITLDKPRKIVFGLMASPAKPMPEDWRAIGRRDHHGIDFSMGWVFGMPAFYAARYPLNKDFSPLNYNQAQRLGAAPPRQKFIDTWARQHLEDADMKPDLKKRLRSGLRSGLHRGGKNPFTAYYDEFYTIHSFAEETPVFLSEWAPRPKPLGPAHGLYEKWGDEPTITHQYKWFSGVIPIRSYRDFGCWYAAEWLRRGVGIYFDNAFCKVPASDPITTNAYRRPNGKIQPSAAVWAKRKYLKRIWVLHQQLRLPETPQTMMVHMTNAHILPWESFNESNLDLEWKMKMGDKPIQQRYPPDLLRAESLGLKTGCVPIAMADPKGVSNRQRLEQLRRQRWAVLLVHEIKPGISTEHYPRPLEEFGYGLDDCRVVNYWDADAPIDVSDPDCKWLLLQRDDRLMLLLVSWNDEGQTVEVNLDTDQLGVDPTTRINAERASSPAISPAYLRTPDGRTGLRAEYFRGQTMDGEPVVMRREDTIDMDLAKHHSPATGVPEIKFGTRWTGKIGPMPETGKYEFILRHDDGARLWIGENTPGANLWMGPGQVIDDWKRGHTRTSRATVQLEKGQTYDVRVDYFNGVAGSHVSLQCEKLRAISHPVKDGGFKFEMPQFGVRLFEVK